MENRGGTVVAKDHTVGFGDLANRIVERYRLEYPAPFLQRMKNTVGGVDDVRQVFRGPRAKKPARYRVFGIAFKFDGPAALDSNDMSASIGTVARAEFSNLRHMLPRFTGFRRRFAGDSLLSVSDG